MRATEFLIEAARGLLYRETGDVFKDPTGRTATIGFIEYLPPSGGAYPTTEEFNKVLVELKKQFPKIQYVNKSDVSTKALAIITLIDTKTNKEIYFAKFFRSITPDMSGKWKNNELPGGWQLQKETSMKAAYKLMPNDIFPDDATFNTTKDLVNAMKSSETGKEYASGVAMLLQKKLPVFKGAGEKFTAIRDNLGEIIGPVALIEGMINDSAIQSAQKVLNNGNPITGVISFSKAKNTGLVDSSILLENGISVGISSKGGAGAKASIKNVMDGVAILRNSDPNNKLLKQYAKEVALIEQIGSMPAIQAPFYILKEYGNLDYSHVQSYVYDLVKTGARDLKSIKDKNSLNIFVHFMSKIKPKDTKGYNVGYHIVAGMAIDAANVVNSMPKFGSACLKFINSSPIIQIHLKATRKLDDVTIDGFDSEYPPNFKGTINIVSGKTYSAAGITGRYSMELKPD